MKRGNPKRGHRRSLPSCKYIQSKTESGVRVHSVGFCIFATMEQCCFYKIKTQTQKQAKHNLIYLRSTPLFSSDFKHLCNGSLRSFVWVSSYFSNWRVWLVLSVFVPDLMLQCTGNVERDLACCQFHICHDGTVSIVCI